MMLRLSGCSRNAPTLHHQRCHLQDEDDPSDMDDFEDELMDVHAEHMPEMDDEDEYVVTQGPTCYCLRAKLTTDRSDCHE